MASYWRRLVIPLLGHCNLSISLLEHFTDSLMKMHHTIIYHIFRIKAGLIHTPGLKYTLGIAEE